ncbi:MAG: hypothetical protein M1823_002637 [Watsoniomyces obsoletus]|nr:MAG: hypothetical protein M1823_002637 [Watsoniomyces obsoletus]
MEHENDDDVKIVNVVHRDQKNDTGDINDESTTDGESASQNQPRSPQRSFPTDGEKVEWSDGDEENPYEKFKQRKALKRKHAAAATRKAKAQAARDGGSSSKKTTGVKAEHPAKKRKTKHDDEGSGDGDEFMDEAMPEYLQRRRKLFDHDRERLKEAGLKLPPHYDDIDFSDDERQEKLQEKPQFPGMKPCAPYKDITLPYSLGVIPAPIAQWLRDYQVEGTAFLHELFVYQKGGILGDDMGLGKTVQVIAFLTAAFGKTGDERDLKRMRKMRRVDDDDGKRWYPRVLVVCPGSLIANWNAEFKRWGYWHVDVYHGDTKEMAIDAARTGRSEIMITTYTTYRINKDVINMIDWDCVVADECHTVKERKAEITQAMNEINALCRIGLTGTAIQNKYEELWTLLNWTNPGRFGPMSVWRASISEPLRVGQSHDATVHQLSRARKTAQKLVQNLLPEFFLRRMKTLIADQLPKKSDRVVFSPMTETQRGAYERFLSTDMVDYIRRATDYCDCKSGKKRGWCCYKTLPGTETRWQNLVFPAIATLQKLSNHLAILIPQGTDPQEKQQKDLKYLQLVLPDRWKELYASRDSIINYANPDFCGKWKVLRKLLRFWHANGDKVLVFSHSVRLLKMLQSLFNHTSYNVSYLDGAMSYDDRARVVDDFNSDPGQFVFLISTKAGGVGLNITSANKVVVVDPNWNPSYDLQAQDRAYRIGQIRDVEVFRLVSVGTIEEVVYARQIYKQQQANIGYSASMERRYFSGVQERKEQKGEIFGLRNLFAFSGSEGKDGEENVVLRQIINKTNVAESKAAVDVVDFDIKNSGDGDGDETGDDEEFGDGDALGILKREKSGYGDHTDDDDGSQAMSQLAQLVAKGEYDDPDDPSGNITSGSGNVRAKQKGTVQGKTTKEKKLKTDAINAILAHAGVTYVHENSEVIGPSSIEARLSKRAVQTEELHPDDPTRIESTVFRREESDMVIPTRGHAGDTTSVPAGGGGEDMMKVRYKFHPPWDVMKRQFCEMARWCGYTKKKNEDDGDGIGDEDGDGDGDDVKGITEFALVMEGWGLEQRRRALEGFYRHRREMLLSSKTKPKAGEGPGSSEKPKKGLMEEGGRNSPKAGLDK